MTAIAEKNDITLSCILRVSSVSQNIFMIVTNKTQNRSQCMENPLTISVFVSFAQTRKMLNLLKLIFFFFLYEFEA